MEKSPFDELFYLDQNDPWLGTKPDFGSIPIKNQLGNEGFYWLWPCLNNPNAPIIIEYIGGPGCCVILKAFTK